MKRLSENARDIVDVMGDLLDYNSEYLPIIDALDKLADYEDAEENGMLVRLPCKVGGNLYFISDEDDEGNDVPTVMECSDGVAAIIITSTEIRVANRADAAMVRDFSDAIGTRFAFLTREEAELALREREAE